MPGLALGTMEVSQHTGPLTVGDRFSNNARLIGPSENSLYHPSCCVFKLFMAYKSRGVHWEAAGWH